MDANLNANVAIDHDIDAALQSLRDAGIDPKDL